MTGNIKLLTEVHEISPSPVGLPNGESMFAVKEWNLALGGDTYLRHVLFVPKLNCTLLPVSKMLHDLNCTVTFANDMCVIHDRTSTTLIGAGELCSGLYQFRAMTPARMNKVDSNDELELWHRRLGHPSRQILANFLAVRSRIVSSGDSAPCDICFRAK